MFYHTHCELQRTQDNRVLGIGKMEHNLYVLNTLAENHFTYFLKNEEMTVAKWHKFLGHPSLSTLRHMPQLRGQFREEAARAIEQCEVCMRAKHTRDPFPLLHRRSDNLFEMIHADVWGPYSHESVSNTRFVLTLVEDHTRAI